MAASISCEDEDEPVRKGSPLSRLSAAAAATEGKSAPAWLHALLRQKKAEAGNETREAGVAARQASCLQTLALGLQTLPARIHPGGSGGGGGRSGPFNPPPPEDSSAHQLYMHLHPSLWRKTTFLLIEIFKINVCPQH